MLNRLHILIACLSLSVLPLLTLAGESSPNALEYYNKGLQFAQSGEFLLAIESFNKAIEQDKRFADAYHQLGLMYLEIGTIQSRRDAERALAKALRFDSDNIQYHLDMSRLLLEKGLKRLARSRYRKILEMDSSNAEAHFQLALLHIDEMFWMKGLTKPLGPITVTFVEEADSHLRKAQALLRAAIQLEPTHVASYYHLALLCYEENDFAGMIDYLNQAIAIDSTNKDLYLFKGLALQKSAKFGSAFLAYQSALQYMSEEQRALFLSVQPLLNEREKAAITGVDSVERAEYQNGFWMQRDPLFLTDYNERLMAHFGRLAYVNLRFGRPKKGVQGWETDRGQTYLRFGPPKHSFHTGSSIEMNFAGNPIRPSEEHWIYDDFTFAYQDLYLTRNYSFKRHLQPEADSKYLYERLIEEMSDRYVLDRPAKAFEIPSVLAQFRGDAGKTRIELTFGIPVVLGPDGPPSLHWQVKRGWFVFDDKWRQVLRRVEQPWYSKLDLSEQNGEHFVIDRILSEVSPGNYNLVVEVLDTETEQFGRLIHQLNVQGFGSDRLEMSDIVLAEALRTNTASVNSNAREVRAIPSFSRVFKRGQKLFVYYEIYNLTLDDNGDSSYRVASMLRPYEPPKNRLQRLASSIAGLFGAENQDDFTVSTSFNFFGHASTERSYHALQVEKMAVGNYVLRIEVTDEQTAQTAHRDIPFQIVD